jgi:hypothetical protein
MVLVQNEWSNIQHACIALIFNFNMVEQKAIEWKDILHQSIKYIAPSLVEDVKSNGHVVVCYSVQPLLPFPSLVHLMLVSLSFLSCHLSYSRYLPDCRSVQNVIKFKPIEQSSLSHSHVIVMNMNIYTHLYFIPDAHPESAVPVAYPWA